MNDSDSESISASEADSSTWVKPPAQQPSGCRRDMVERLEAQMQDNQNRATDSCCRRRHIMAPCAELMLDDNGDLVSLFSATGDLLTPDQVASCVKFIELEVDPENDDELKMIQLDKNALQGLKVNVFGGAAGVGKTSLIQLMAGGSVTEAKMSSDTRCPTVYIITQERVKYAILDTAGLCDTVSDANKDVGMQELLINAVAATIQANRLEIVSFNLCIDATGRLPGNFAEIWPTMQISLGGDRLMKLGTFVVTKANGGGAQAQKSLNKLARSPLWKALQESSFQWPVVSAGQDNLDEIFNTVKPLDSGARGIGSEAVDAMVESIQSKEADLPRVLARIKNLEDAMSWKCSDAKDLQGKLQSMQNELWAANEELASVGLCGGKQKAHIRQRIKEKQRTLKIIQANAATGQLSKEQLEKDINQWKAGYDKSLADIKAMRGIGAAFKMFATGVGRAMGVVQAGDGNSSVDVRPEDCISHVGRAQ